MNTAPTFFIPSNRPLNHEPLYLQIKAYVQYQFATRPITDRLIFKLICEHNGTSKVPGQYPTEVGKPIHEKGETVIAIFEIKDWYLVCTKTRGALAGHLHCVFGEDVVEAMSFVIGV